MFGDLEEIYYFCSMNKIIRSATYTKEFEEYYQSLPQKVKDKYDFVFEIMLTKYVVSTTWPYRPTIRTPQTR